ncbi:hypothetical protein Tcan_17377 [Toxocara canis]|uniref:Uncharacterized protein n=1 Tax=Toxocara canis TaxID=6265 RepID=A0A0B2UIF1_TOXCA|nr:hypothetical protein Tcan_17377 [Toxocara canis]
MVKDQRSLQRRIAQVDAVLENPKIFKERTSSSLVIVHSTQSLYFSAAHDWGPLVKEDIRMLNPLDETVLVRSERSRLAAGGCFCCRAFICSHQKCPCSRFIF